LSNNNPSTYGQRVPYSIRFSNVRRRWGWAAVAWLSPIAE
jgi:hypothetical protein